MRALGITAAAIIGAFVGLLIGVALGMAVNTEPATVPDGAIATIGLVAGGVGLPVWVARLVPRKPSRLRERGVERMRRS